MNNGCIEIWFGTKTYIPCIIYYMTLTLLILMPLVAYWEIDLEITNIIISITQRTQQLNSISLPLRVFYDEMRYITHFALHIPQWTYLYGVFFVQCGVKKMFLIPSFPWKIQ